MPNTELGILRKKEYNTLRLNYRICERKIAHERQVAQPIHLNGLSYNIGVNKLHAGLEPQVSHPCFRGSIEPKRRSKRAPCDG